MTLVAATIGATGTSSSISSSEARYGRANGQKRRTIALTGMGGVSGRIPGLSALGASFRRNLRRTLFGASRPTSIAIDAPSRM